MANSHVLFFALWFWLMPFHTCLKIVLPHNATKNEPVQVNLTFEKADPTTFFLKKYRLDDNQFASPVFPVGSFNKSAVQRIPFTTAQRYVVAAMVNPMETSLTSAFNFSNEIQISESPSSQHQSCGMTANDTGGATTGVGKSSAGSDTRQSLSGGSIAGISFGVLIFVIVIGVLVYLYHSRSRLSFRSRGTRRHYSSRVRDYLIGRSPPTLNRKPPPPISADPEAYLPPLSPPRPVFHNDSAQGSQKSVLAPSMTTLNVSPITERQSEIHQRLYELQDRLLRLQRNEELGDMSAQKAIEMTETKIVALRSFVDSPWALHMTDEIPTRLKQCL